MSTVPDLTISEFLALHPWPAAHAARPRLEWLWTFDIPIPPGDLWRVVADSSRMNRALGMTAMSFEDREGQRHGTSRPGGILQSWIEVPWNWVVGQWLQSERVFERGFAHVSHAVFRLTPREVDGRPGTRLHVYFGAVPRGVLGRIALKLGFPGLEHRYRRLWKQIAAELNRQRPALPPAVATMPDDANARLAGLRDTLRARGLDGAAIDRLAEWIRTGDDTDLARIQVRERARAWNVDEDALLRVCLHGTRAGLLELSWDVVCPHCRGAVDELGDLSAVAQTAACEVCGIEFGTDTPETIEITFHVHPSLRVVSRAKFCSAEPATKEHVRVQRAVAAGAETAVALALPVGRYRMRLMGEKRYGYLDVGAGAEGELTWRAGAAPGEHAIATEAKLTLINDSAATQIFVVEAAQWADLALRPNRLLSFQDFRDLFSDEYLGADVKLGVGEQTILFTDIVGSTAMYAARGDPAAFIHVKRHFVEVVAIIARHRGAVVKTMGDATMAAFDNPLHAVQAAKEIQDCLSPSRDDDVPRLRISLNTGPCIAVTLDKHLDFFGQTVNLAAKLQAHAESWQIAMSQAVYDAPGVAEWIAAQGARLADEVYESKAIQSTVPVKVWTVHGGS